MNGTKIHLLLCALTTALCTMPSAAAPADRAMRRAVAEAHAAIDLYERTARTSQSLEEINAAAREEVMRQLHLDASQRKEFEPLYDAYRQELAAIAQTATASIYADEATQREALKQRLDNIAAAARIKRDYVDRFARVLTAEQIRQLYNAEANVGTQIKTSSVTRTSQSLTLRGDGGEVERDFGPAHPYTTLIVPSEFKVILSPTARTIRVTTDERLIDFVTVEQTDGELRLRLNIKRLNVRNAGDFRGIQVELPLSAQLRRIEIATYGSVESPQPLRSAGDLRLVLQSAGRMEADLACEGRVELLMSSYGSFKGTVTCRDLKLELGSATTFEGPIRCRGRADVSVSNYAQMKSDLRAEAAAKLLISSAAKVSGTVESGSTELQVSSYGWFKGTVHAARFKVYVAPRATGDIAYTGEAFEAQILSYGWLKLSGTGTVARGKLDVAPRGRFSAPDLPVREYEIDASSYSSLDIRCEQRLQLRKEATARVENHGPAQAEARP